MKISLVGLGLAALGMLGLASCAAPSAASRAGTSSAAVVVHFDHPEKFADVRDGFPGTDSGRDEILGRVQEYVVRRVGETLGANYRVTVTFTDFKLAGDFEPWRGPEWDRIRVVREIYPPAMAFTWAVTDAGGRPVVSGAEDLRDMAFQMRPILDHEDTLAYEKSMLDDWVRERIAPLARPGGA